MHSVSNIDTTAAVGDCAACGPAVPLRRKSNGAGRAPGWRCKRAVRLGRGSAGTATGKHRRRLRARGAVFEDADLGEVLATTACENPGCRSTVALVVDHDHASGALRGRLCATCNTALGMLGDDPERITGLVTYLAQRERISA